MFLYNSAYIRAACQQLLKRKGNLMPRPPREIVPGGIYHVTTRGNNRQDIFLDKEDRSIYLSLLETAKEMFEFMNSSCIYMF